MKLTHQQRQAPGFLGLVMALLLGLLAAPLPLHSCMKADAGGCSCCCSHDGAVMSCCAGESAPEPSCCFTVDADPGVMPSQHRDAAPTLHLISTLAAVAPHAVCPPAPTAAAPSACHAGSTARRLSVLCSFLN